MFRSILVPLDGSGFSETALPYAMAVRRRTGAALHLATVHEPVPGFAHEEWDSAAWKWSEDYLGSVMERLDQEGSDVDAWVGAGPVVDLLVNRAEAVGADLVVMASHGRGALSRAWLGSVADGLLRRARQPVLLVRPPEAAAEGGGPPDAEKVPEPAIRRILVPLDGSELSESVVGLATDLARTFEAGLRLVRVVAYPVEIASPYLPHTVQMNQQVVDEAREGATRYLDGVAERMRAAGLNVEAAVVVDAQAGHAIALEADKTEADLIVMATHGRGGLQRALLGSTADKVIRAVHIPVLVRRPDE